MAKREKLPYRVDYYRKGSGVVVWTTYHRTEQTAKKFRDKLMASGTLGESFESIIRPNVEQASGLGFPSARHA